MFAFSEPAAAALGRMYAYRRWLDSEAASEPVPVSDIDRPWAATLIEATLGAGDDHLGVGETFELLRCYGIPAPETVLVARDDVLPPPPRSVIRSR